MVLDPKHRVSAFEAMDHPWLEAFNDEYKQDTARVERTCVPFDEQAFAFENNIPTEYSLRHLMYQEIANYSLNRKKRLEASKNWMVSGR